MDERHSFEGCSLCKLRYEDLRRAQFLQGSAGRDMSLNYVRDKEGHEIDFALCENGDPIAIAELKLSNPSVPPTLLRLPSDFPQPLPAC